MLTQLNYTVSAELLQEAAQSLPKDEFRTVINEPTGSFFYDPWQIKDEYQGSVWHKILDCLPESQGEARIITLNPGKCYQSHADIDDRYHLNISGAEHSHLLDLNTKTIYDIVCDGHWYKMNGGHIHSAVNFGLKDRVQLVVRHPLEVNELSNPIKVKILATRSNLDDARFFFDQQISPWLNYANRAHLINDFTYSAEQVTFTVEYSLLSRVKQLVAPEFELVVC